MKKIGLNKLIVKIFYLIIILVFLSSLLLNDMVIAIEDTTNKNNMISVKDNGAKGDGKTDDTIAIQKVIDKCDENKETTVFLPSGVYCITKPINLSKSNINLIGEKDNTVIKCNFENITTNKYLSAIFCNNESSEKDIENVNIENINIDIGKSSTEEYDTQTMYGSGILISRKQKNQNDEYYKMSNISIKNCKIQNAYSFGIIVEGSKKLKTGYTLDKINSELKTYKGDYDERKYYDYYNVENVEILNCSINKSRVGIGTLEVENTKILDNNVRNSECNNIMMSGKNIDCIGNTIGSHSLGTGSIVFDKSEKIKINNNLIDEKNSTNNELYRNGIYHNSEKGPSYYAQINNNYILNASRGIWLKDSRYMKNTVTNGNEEINCIGSRPGAGFTIEDNIIKSSGITDLRIDELLNKRVDNEEKIGLSYLINLGNNSINIEAEKNSDIGYNIKNGEDDNLWQINTTFLKQSNIMTVTIKSNRELKEIEHWTLSDDKLSLKVKYYLSASNMSVFINKNIDLLDIQNNKYTLYVSSENYIGKVEDKYLPIIGCTNSAKSLRVGYSEFDINEKGKYKEITQSNTTRYVLTDDSIENCEGDSIYIVLENIEENDEIDLMLNNYLFDKKVTQDGVNKTEKGNGYYKIGLKNNNGNFEINTFKTPSNLLYRRDNFICNTEKNEDKYKITIRFKRATINRKSDNLNVYCEITSIGEDSTDKIEKIFENSNTEDITTWNHIIFEQRFMIDKQNEIIKNLVENRTNIENKEIVKRKFDEKVIDLMIFMGQSNMVGYGNIELNTEEKIDPIKDEEGNTINKEFQIYDYDETTNTKSELENGGKLVEMSEPFGKGQNAIGSEKPETSGTMVTALTNAYYKETGVPVVGVISAIGGKSIYNSWNEENGKDVLLKDAIYKYKKAIKYLEENGYTIRNKYMIWCQGEADASNPTNLPNVSKDTYEQYLKDGESYKEKLNYVINSMQDITVEIDGNEKKSGIDKTFIVRIGNRMGSNLTHNNIQEIQTEMCKTQNNVVLASTALKALSSCKEEIWNDSNNRFEYAFFNRPDLIHYHQEGYNLVGYDAGKNIAYYSNTGNEPELTDYEVDYENKTLKAIKYTSNFSSIVKKGDINSDGIIDVSDLGILAAYIVEKADLKDDRFKAGDLNNDGIIDISDLSIIAESIVK